MIRTIRTIVLLVFLLSCLALGKTTENLAEDLSKSTVKISGRFIEKDVLLNDDKSWFGSGVIIDQTDDEYIIVTNLHVIGFWDMLYADLTSSPEIIFYSLNVTMPDGESTKVKRILINKDLKDYALLFVNSSIGDYPSKGLSEEMPQQGASVYAMGHPLGFEYSFTSGVISGSRKHKSPLGVGYTLLQTDTPINSGNSGGPLIDSNGNIVGINTSKIMKTGVEGLNFAIWSNEIIQSGANEEFIEFPLSPPSKIGHFVEMMQSR